MVAICMDEGYRSFLTKGQAFLEDLFGGKLVWNGRNYSCANSGSRNGDQLEDGGFVEVGNRNVRILKTSMVAPPVIGELMFLNDQEVRLVEIGDREWDVAWHFQFQPVRGE
jgi:hypothetical protein